MLPRDLLKRPSIRLSGTVNEDMLRDFLRQADQVRDAQGPLLLELSTLGGEADTARRIAEEIRLLLTQFDADLHFIGKTMVQSAGITIMSAFPVARRFLSADAALLVHERHMERNVTLSGSLSVCEAMLQEVQTQIDIGKRSQQEDFKKFISGSDVALAELTQRIGTGGWHLRAEEALQRRLIAGVV